VPGATNSGAWPQQFHISADLGIAFARADGVGCCKEAIDVGAVEWWCIDRGNDVMSEHARTAHRPALPSRRKWSEVEMPLEAPLPPRRLQKLLLPGGSTRAIRSLSPLGRGFLVSLICDTHGQGLT
jgi:hypothetical protein